MTNAPATNVVPGAPVLPIPPCPLCGSPDYEARYAKTDYVHIPVTGVTADGDVAEQGDLARTSAGGAFFDAERHLTEDGPQVLRCTACFVPVLVTTEAGAVSVRPIEEDTAVAGPYLAIAAGAAGMGAPERVTTVLHRGSPGGHFDVTHHRTTDAAIETALGLIRSDGERYAREDPEAWAAFEALAATDALEAIGFWRERFAGENEVLEILGGALAD